MNKPAACIMLALASLGCDDDSQSPSGPARISLGEPIAVAQPVSKSLPAELQGDWTFDEARTLAEWKKRMSPAEYDNATALMAQLKGLGVPIRTDLTIAGLTATGRGALLQPQYDVVSWQETAGVISARAWHHEDRHDPGDMAMIDLRLRIVDGELWWEEGEPGELSRFIYRRGR